MAAKVLFFGQDTHRCIPVLTRAGYSINAFDSVLELHPCVADESDAAAVAVSGAWQQPFLHDPISIARDRTTVPFVLFAGPGEHRASPAIFDLVVPPTRPTSQWLSELDLLIRECQATRAQARKTVAASDLLREQTRDAIAQLRLDREWGRLERESSQAARERTRFELDRSLREISRNAVDMTGRWDLQEIPGMVDFLETLPVCTPCEERDRLNWSIMIAVAQLTGLLFKGAKVRLDNEKPEQIDALRAEEKSLAVALQTLLMQWKAHRASHGC